jgi:hypothetical protein
MRRLVVAALGLTLAAALPFASVPAAGASGGFAPYHNPPFHCRVLHYADGRAPDPLTTPRDPLCVDYSKRDITADDGGAIRFLLAEPDRFAVAATCRYWQQDHWRVRIDRGYGSVVRWDGSYWWDIPAGSGAGILRHFRIDGQPVGARQAAAAVAVVSPVLAAQIRKYGTKHDGSAGATINLPSGGA